jgi:hypothetical protein
MDTSKSNQLAPNDFFERLCLVKTSLTIVAADNDDDEGAPPNYNDNDSAILIIPTRIWKTMDSHLL